VWAMLLEGCPVGCDVGWLVGVIYIVSRQQWNLIRTPRGQKSPQVYFAD